MPYCFAPECNHVSRRETCRFYRFPTDENRFKKWRDLCRRQDREPNKEDRLCSCHFVDGKNNKETGPSIFKHYKDKINQFPRPEKRKSYEQNDSTENNSEEEKVLVAANICQKIDISTQTTSVQDSELLRMVHKQQKEIWWLKEQLQKGKQEDKSVEGIFTPGQLRKLKTSKLKTGQIFWTVEDITSAVSLYAAGPTAYRLLEKRGYPLPSVSILRRWATKINIQPGILNMALSLIKMRNTTLTKMERSCILLVNEMKLDSLYGYDKKTDTTLAPAKNAQIIMARGICANWSQPIFYNYDCKITKNLISDVITKLHQIGYPVYAINCHTGLWNEWNISEENTSFVHPVSHKAVHVFADAPDLFKLLRNHLVDGGYVFDGKVINSKPIVDLLQNTQSLESNTDLSAVKGDQRQKLDNAAELFSQKMSKEISTLGMLGHYETENWSECSEFIKTVIEWFGVFNTESFALTEHNYILDKMKIMVNKMRKIGTNTRLPFQTGIIISIESLKKLFLDLKKYFNIEYLSTHNLNQNPLMSIMAVVDHPSVLKFKNLLCNHLIGRIDQSDEHDQPSTSAIIRNANQKQQPQILTAAIFSSLDLPEDDESQDKTLKEIEDIEWDGSESFASFLVLKLRHKEQLGTPQNFLVKCNELDHIFTHHNGDSLKIESNYLANLIKLATSTKLSQEAKHMFFTCKLYARMRMLNGSFSETSDKRKRKISK